MPRYQNPIGPQPVPQYAITDREHVSPMYRTSPDEAQTANEMLAVIKDYPQNQPTQFLRGLLATENKYLPTTMPYSL